MVIASSGSRTVYDVFVGLHVVCALAGFGSVALSGVYGGAARRGAPAGGPPEEASRFFRSGNRAEFLVLVVPVFGLLALAFRPGGHEFGAVWVTAGALIWIAASGVLLGVVRPAEATLRALARSPVTDRATGEAMGRAGGRLVWASAASDVLFVVALGFMVTQPR